MFLTLEGHARLTSGVVYFRKTLLTSDRFPPGSAHIPLMIKGVIYHNTHLGLLSLAFKMIPNTSNVSVS